MGNRYYSLDNVLPCGCMISLDKGGGVMPCYAEFGDMRKKKDKEAFELHIESWKEYRKSKKFKIHQREINRRND